MINYGINDFSSYFDKLETVINKNFFEKFNNNLFTKQFAKMTFFAFILKMLHLKKRRNKLFAMYIYCISKYTTDYTIQTDAGTSVLAQINPEKNKQCIPLIEITSHNNKPQLNDVF